MDWESFLDACRSFEPVYLLEFTYGVELGSLCGLYSNNKVTRTRRGHSQEFGYSEHLLREEIVKTLPDWLKLKPRSDLAAPDWMGHLHCLDLELICI